VVATLYKVFPFKDTYNSVLYSLLLIFLLSPFKKRFQRACEGNAEAEDKQTRSI